MKAKQDFKKILMISHSSNLTGGGENDFQTLLEHFHGRYYIYSIIPEGPRVTSIKELSNEILVIPDKIFPFTCFNLKNYIIYIYYSVVKLFTFIPFVLRNKKYIDIAFVNSSVCIIEVFVLSFFRIPYYVSIKEIIEPKSIRNIFYRFFYNTSENVIVISKALKKLYTEVNKESKPIIIRSAIDEKSYSLEKAKLINASRKTNNEFTIVNIGVIAAIKNQKLLIDAASELSPGIRVRILFIGKIVDVKYYNDINRLINTYNLKNVEFIFTNDLPKFKVLEEIYKSDCVVITSLKEGMSLVLVECLFMEKPLIATKVGVIPEVIKDGFNGFTINNNSKELALVIEKLQSDSSLCQYISSNAFKSYEGNFKMEYYKSKHEEALFCL